MSDLSDRDAIREMYARYCFYVDEGRPDLFAQEFTADGIMWLSDRGSYRGREEIEAHVGRRTGKTFHLIHNVAIDVVEAERAVSHAYFQLIDPTTALTVAYGTYDDLLARSQDRWLWNRKRVNYRFRSPEYIAVAETMHRDDYGQDGPAVPAFGAALPR